jgi:hypothetical protein
MQLIGHYFRQCSGMGWDGMEWPSNQKLVLSPLESALSRYAPVHKGYIVPILMMPCSEKVSVTVCMLVHRGQCVHCWRPP